MKLSVLTPERVVLKDVEVEKVRLTGSEGQIEILPGHVHMVGSLETGIFGYDHSGKSEHGAISTGFFEIHDDKIKVIAETLELSSEIDIARAKTAEDKARQKLKEPGLGQENFKKHQLKLERALIRQQASNKHH